MKVIYLKRLPTRRYQSLGQTRKKKMRWGQSRLRSHLWNVTTPVKRNCKNKLKRGHLIRSVLNIKQITIRQKIKSTDLKVTKS